MRETRPPRGTLPRPGSCEEVFWKLYLRGLGCNVLGREHKRRTLHPKSEIMTCTSVGEGKVMEKAHFPSRAVFCWVFRNGSISGIMEMAPSVFLYNKSKLLLSTGLSHWPLGDTPLKQRKTCLSAYARARPLFEWIDSCKNGYKQEDKQEYCHQL